MSDFDAAQPTVGRISRITKTAPLLQYEPDVERRIGADAEHVPAERRVVQRAEREPVRHDGAAGWPSGPHKRNAPSVVVEPAGENVPRKRVGVQPSLFLEELERPESDAAVGLLDHWRRPQRALAAC